ncbi:MAG: DUF3887 domain-containing protein [Phascolarctobacterium sp.]|nr:DUF3887 domain-containing protein [Phascolarctobacterium sp.]MBR2140226.1 DUF3887 domain-containing protein [Phascolarctobacterium sp.]
MKKLVLMLFVICMMICSVGFAGNDHKSLAKQQQVAEKIMDAFDIEPMPLFAQVSAGFNANLKKAVDEKAFAELQKQVRARFGTMKEAKLFAYQRFDQADRVTYIASFSKEKMVSMVFVFDKQNKLVDFAFTPVQQQVANK